MPSLRPAILAGCIALAALAAGCNRPAGPEVVRRPSVRTDPCAERLHDLCGRVLLYYSIHRKLPAAAAELASGGASPGPPLVCPVSGRPYVYVSEGVTVKGRPGRLILYDAAATHNGMRWGILVDRPTGRPNITARVILVSDKDLTAAP